MEYNVKTLTDYLLILDRRKVWLFGTSAVVLFFTFTAALVLPPVYQSTATILIEQQEIPQDLVQSTVTSYADQRLQVISQRVMTRSNLLGIIQKYSLFAEENEKGIPLESIIDKMRQKIGMEMVSADVIDPRSGRPTQATIAFTVSYQDANPSISQSIANELTSLYLNENLNTRTRQAAETSDFLSDEVKRVGVLVSELEAKLADFKEQNVGSLPEMDALNRQLMDRTERELTEAEHQVQALKERKIYLASQVASLNPYSTMYSNEGERVLSPVDRLKLLQTKYITMSATYGPDLPDLVKLRKEIAALKAEVGSVDNASELEARLQARIGELTSARQKYSEDHPFVQRLAKEVEALKEEVHAAALTPTEGKEASSMTPDNPAYLQAKAQLDSADADLRANEGKVKKLAEKLALYESRIMESPQVERTYRELSRDYDNAQLKYKELRAKEMQAQLSSTLETEKKGERFTMIEPPQLPEKPIKPNRLAILFLGFVFSLGGGVGASILRDNVDNAVYSSTDVLQLAGVPPLATISYITVAEELAQKKETWRRVAVGGVVFLVLSIVFVHFAVKPLDVVWFILARRVGL